MAFFAHGLMNFVPTFEKTLLNKIEKKSWQKLGDKSWVFGLVV
jgi:hypothetical protein